MPATIETQAQADEKMVDLPSDGDSVDVKLDDTEKKINKDDDIEVVNESKEVVIEDKGKTDTASESEMDDYGKKVQSRIDKLTKKLRESERREQAAVQFAQGMQTENKDLRTKAQSLDDGYVQQYENRVKTETEEAKRRLKSAVETGNVDEQVAANQDLARLSVESERVKETLSKKQRLKKQQEETGGQEVPNQQQYAAPKMPPPAPDPKAEDWAQKNEWFGSDEPMTLTSFSIHRKLMEEGFDPQSDMYYSEIDKRMRDTFPHKFQSSTPTQTVASVNRSNQPAKRKGTVRLTPSQVAIAKKLGVPLSEYAKYVKE